METRAALVTLTGMVERLVEKVERLERAQAAPVAPDQGSRPGDWLGRLLNSKPSGLFAFTSNAVTVWPLACAVIVGILKWVPPPPAAASTWSMGQFLRPLLPVAGAISLVALLVLASRGLKRKSVRFRFVAGIMVCYGVATVLYLAWQSLFFFHYNTLPSGALLALTWVGIASILRRGPGEIKEMGELIRVQMDKEAQERVAVPPPPSKPA